jgi:hypothetical protein
VPPSRRSVRVGRSRIPDNRPGAAYFSLVAPEGVLIRSRLCADVELADLEPIARARRSTPTEGSPSHLIWRDGRPALAVGG